MKLKQSGPGCPERSRRIGKASGLTPPDETVADSYFPFARAWFTFASRSCDMDCMGP